VEGERKWTASDIGMKERACAWMPHGFMSVNTKVAAGRAFLRSLYAQYAEWGVDFGNVLTPWDLFTILHYVSSHLFYILLVVISF